jgi:hypothetical protein
VRSGPGEARTILLLHIISVRPSKQPLMVRTFLKVYMELGSYFLFLQEQIKDIIIIIGSNARICMGSAKPQASGVQRRSITNSTTARPPRLDMPVARIEK